MTPKAQKRTTRAALVAGAAVVAIGLGFAGTVASAADTGTPAPAASSTWGQHNMADVHFASHMIPHHRQAIVMADLAAKYATTAEVQELAAAIGAAQGKEIREMERMLQLFGEPVPDPANDSAHHNMPGMVSMADMMALKNARGVEFDRLFLQLMIEHHEGAVMMAHHALMDGVNKHVAKLAVEIRDVQVDEIAYMRDLLTKL